MSLLESLVVMALIVVIVFSSISFFQQQKTFLSFTSNAGTCRNILESQMGYLRQLGTTPSSTGWIHPAGTGGQAETTSHPDGWLQDTFRYAINPPLFTPASSMVDHSGLGLSTVAALDALYNQNPSFCSDGVDVASLPQKPNSIFFPQYDSTAVREFQSRIRIQALNLKDGSLSCPALPIAVRPQGVQDAALWKPHQLPAKSNPDYGYRVTLSGSFKDTGGLTNTCELTEDFHYPVDYSSQNLGAIVTASFSPAQANPSVQRPQCSHQRGMASALDLKISIRPNDGNSIEPGTVILCADMSQQMNKDWCVHNGVPAPGAGMQGQDYNTGGSKTPQDAQWVPCSEVTACGIPPTRYNQSIDPNIPGGVVYDLNYSGANGNSPDGLWGCDIRIDIATVDPAGNFQILTDNPRAINPKPYAMQYFPTADCYSCWKKKKRKWGSFIISTILFGPILSCLAGVGGVCRPKGLQFVGYNCNGNPDGASFCQRMAPKRPDWTPAPGDTCNELTGPNANPELGHFTLPRSPSGAIYENLQIDPATGKYCEHLARCDNGSWARVPDEENMLVPFSTCGVTYTQYRVDISNSPNGSPPPAGQPMCFVPVPDGSQLSLPGSSVYTGYRVCDPFHVPTGTSAPVLCRTTTDSDGGIVVEFPSDTQTGQPNNTNPLRYFYYERTYNASLGLPPCSE